MMFSWSVLPLGLLLLALAGLGRATEFSSYGSCCNYCRADGDLWVATSSPWNLTVDSLHVTDFHQPAGFFLGDLAHVDKRLHDGDYTVHYAGVPVALAYNSVTSQAASVLDQQYIQVDLGSQMDVTAVSTQGGFFYEENDELLDQRETWMTSFALSYSTSLSTNGPFSFYTHENGEIQVFVANSDHTDTVLNSLEGAISTRALRFHPLGVPTRRGPTTQVLVRIGLIACSGSSSCSIPRVNCEMHDWSSWDECVCTSGGCTQRRSRDIYRFNACAGLPCPHRNEEQPCVQPAPFWQTAVIYGACALAGLIVILVVVILLVKRHQKHKESVIFDATSERKFERKVKEKKRKASVMHVRDADAGHEVDGDLEAAVSPRQVKVQTDASQESLPDLEHMYKVQRDEVVSAPAPVTTSSTPDSQKRLVQNSSRNSNMSDALMDELNAIG